MTTPAATALVTEKEGPSFFLDQLEAENKRALADAETISVLITSCKKLHADNVILARRFKEAQAIIEAHVSERHETAMKQMELAQAQVVAPDNVIMKTKNAFNKT